MIEDFLPETLDFRHAGKHFLSLTLMLLVANLANTKCCKKPEKGLETWHMGTHLRVLNESFAVNTYMTGFRWFSKSFTSLLWTQVASAVEGSISGISGFITFLWRRFAKYGSLCYHFFLPLYYFCTPHWKGTYGWFACTEHFSFKISYLQLLC